MWTAGHSGDGSGDGDSGHSLGRPELTESWASNFCHLVTIALCGVNQLVGLCLPCSLPFILIILMMMMMMMILKHMHTSLLAYKCLFLSSYSSRPTLPRALEWGGLLLNAGGQGESRHVIWEHGSSGRQDLQLVISHLDRRIPVIVPFWLAPWVFIPASLEFHMPVVGRQGFLWTGLQFMGPVQRIYDPDMIRITLSICCFPKSFLGVMLPLFCPFLQMLS